MNSTKINMDMQISVIHSFSLSSYTAGLRMPRSYGSSVFAFSGNLLLVPIVSGQIYKLPVM